MPPEQAEGRLHAVNERSDVYGLGAILYEILTGRPPFEGPDSQQIIRQVIHEMPERPRRRVATVPAALEAVCLKALAKEPAARYVSATALADDVRHWLAGESVSAYPEPWTARRGVDGPASHARHVRGRGAGGRGGQPRGGDAGARRRQSRNTRGARPGPHAPARGRDPARPGRAPRPRNAGAARPGQGELPAGRDAVEEYTSKVANDPRLKEKDLESLRKELLKSATKFFQKLTEQPGDAAPVRADLGRAYRDLGYLVRTTGDAKNGVAHGEKALALFDQLHAEAPDDAPIKRELAKTCTDLGNALNTLGDTKRPAALHRRAIRLLDGDKDSTARKHLAEAYDNLAYFLDEHAGEPGDVTATYAKAVAVLEALSAAEHDVARLVALGSAYTDLGWRYVEIGELKRGGQALDHGVRTLQEAVAKAAADPLALGSLAAAIHARGMFKEQSRSRRGAGGPRRIGGAVSQAGRRPPEHRVLPARRGPWSEQHGRGPPALRRQTRRQRPVQAIAATQGGHRRPLPRCAQLPGRLGARAAKPQSGPAVARSGEGARARTQDRRDARRPAADGFAVPIGFGRQSSDPRHCARTGAPVGRGRGRLSPGAGDSRRAGGQESRPAQVPAQAGQHPRATGPSLRQVGQARSGGAGVARGAGRLRRGGGRLSGAPARPRRRSASVCASWPATNSRTSKPPRPSRLI